MCNTVILLFFSLLNHSLTGPESSHFFKVNNWQMNGMTVHEKRTKKKLLKSNVSKLTLSLSLFVTES